MFLVYFHWHLKASRVGTQTQLCVVAFSCNNLLPVSGSQSPKPACSSQLCVSVDAACCCASQLRHPERASRGNINEQIATALLRLQHDMTNVLHRLHTLEVLTVSQVKNSACSFTFLITNHLYYSLITGVKKISSHYTYLIFPSGTCVRICNIDDDSLHDSSIY